MTSEPDNTPDEDVTDNAQPSDNDTANDLDWYDPDEDQDTVPQEEAAPDDEAEAEAPEETEEPAVVYAEETARVKLADGTEIPVVDLIKGRMLQQDYTRKTQEVANERKTVQADVERMQRITTQFVEHLTNLVPDPPSPELLYSDPVKAFQQQQIHERAMSQVQKLIEMGNAPKEIGGAMSEADDRRRIQETDQRLIEMFPEAANGATRVAFVNGIQSAASDLGFSAEELSSVRDPRIFALAHWARKGMEADKARATAKAKVAAAPPATPRKPGQGAVRPSGNADAMRRLRKNDSIENAIAALSSG